MDAAVFLHIRRRNSSPTRVLELTASTIRVGGGLDCDVRLGGDVPDGLACTIERSAGAWHVQPADDSVPMSVDGRACSVDQTLPLGSILRVGDHWLTLQPSRDHGSPPRALEPPAPAAAPTIVVEATAAVPPASANAETAEARLAHWQTTQASRERWLKDRQKERGWEARWKAAGEALRARASDLALKPAQPSPPAQPGVGSYTRPAASPTLRATQPTARSAPSPVVDRVAGFGTVATPAPMPASRHVPPPSTPVAPGLSAADPIVETAVTIPFPVTPGPRTAPSLKIADTEDFEEIERSVLDGDRPEDAEDRRLIESADIDSILGGLGRDVLGDAAATHVDFTALPAPAAEPDPIESIGVVFEVDVEGGMVAPAIEFQETLLATIPEPPVAVVPAEMIPAAVVPSSVDAVEEREARDPEWPSARSILANTRPRAARPPRAAGKSRTGTARVVAAPAAARVTRPGEMTEPASPGMWRVPAIVAGPTTLASVVGVAVVGVAIAWVWSADARAVAPMADSILKRGELPPAGSIPAPTQVDASWWRSTAAGLYASAIAADRSADEAERDDRTRFYLNAARAASPLRPDVRLALARRPAGPEDARPAAPSGLSRDVDALAWSGRELLAAGRVEEAGHAFAASIDMVLRAVAVDSIPAPIAAEADSENDAPRFPIAGEDVLGPVVRLMAECPDWGYARWSSALSGSALAHLAAYRVLKDRESPDAPTALRAAAEAGEPAPGYARAAHLAAKAEALAIESRWAESEAAYRAALAAKPTPAVGRSWWANLADVQGRRGGDAERRESWDRATEGAGAGDVVGRRVARARARAGQAVAIARARTPGGTAAPAASPETQH